MGKRNEENMLVRDPAANHAQSSEYFYCVLTKLFRKTNDVSILVTASGGGCRQYSNVENTNTSLHSLSMYRTTLMPI
jgi:myo-inositol-hexaphosphate 3-phosphohydrolase